MPRFSYILVQPLGTFERDDQIRSAFAFLRGCGYEGVELNLTKPVGVDLEDLKKWLAEHELVVPSFLTGAGYNDGLCLSSSDASVRHAAINRLCGYVDIAQQFGAILVVGLMQGLRSDEPDPDVANRRIADCLADVARKAEQRGVDIVMEPVNHLQVGFNNSVAEVRQLIATIGSSAIKPMVDTIHMNIEERSLTEPIIQCGSALRHVHLCESNGALFGTGNVDFPAVIDALDQIDYAHFASVKIYRASLEEGARSAMEVLSRCLTKGAGDAYGQI